MSGWDSYAAFGTAKGASGVLICGEDGTAWSTVGACPKVSAAQAATLFKLTKGDQKKDVQSMTDAHRQSMKFGGSADAHQFMVTQWVEEKVLSGKKGDLGVGAMASGKAVVICVGPTPQTAAIATLAVVEQLAKVGF